MCLASVPGCLVSWYEDAPAPDLGGAQGAGPKAPHQRGPPTMFVCLAICATCGCHLVIFSEKSMFVDAINYYRSAKQQYFTGRIFAIVTKQLLHLLVSWKPVKYLNLVNARPSQVEHVSLRLNSFLEDFVSATLRFPQVAYENSIARYGYHTPSFWSTCPLFSWEINYSLMTFENFPLFAFLLYIVIISGVTRALSQVENLAENRPLALYRAH